MNTKSILTIALVAVASVSVCAQSTRGGSNTRRTTTTTKTDGRAQTQPAQNQEVRRTNNADNRATQNDKAQEPKKVGPAHPSRTTTPVHVHHHVVEQPVPHVGYHPTPVVVSGPPPVAVVPYAVPAAPAPGTIVEMLPPGCVFTKVGGVSVYVSAGVSYTPIWIGGRLYYKVL